MEQKINNLIGGLLKWILNKIQRVSFLLTERVLLYCFFPKKYDCPIPFKKEVLKRQHQIFNIEGKGIAGIELNEKEQLGLLEELKKYYKELPFEENKKENLRYYYNNNMILSAQNRFSYLIICLMG